MKNALIATAIAVTLALSGCAFDQKIVIQKEIVTVDKPIPFVPKPPTVPPFVSQVDQLTMADAIDPGKVGIAYKYDMTQLRALISIYKMILDQYNMSSQDFDKINAEIDKMYTQLNQAEAAKVQEIASAPSP